MKRLTSEHPDWTMDFIDQASTQWTLALLFDLLAEHLSPE